MTNKLHRRQQDLFFSKATEILYGGAAGGGKAENINNLIPTPFGFSKIGDLKVGDKIFNNNGQLTEVIETHPINYNPTCYSVVFNTGETIDCDINHLWVTKNDKEREQSLRLTPEFRERRKKNRLTRALNNPTKLSSQVNITKLNKEREYIYKEAPKGTIRTTKEILETLKIKHGNIERFNHSIDVCGAIDLPHKELLIDPYLLGLWLGDGHRKTGRIGMMEEDINNIQNSFDLKIISKSYDRKKSIPYIEIRSEGLRDNLIKYKILNKKRIPLEYLRSSIEQRRELLRGLMDTDGSCDKRGQCEVGLSDKELMDDVHELVSSLGIIATIRIKELNKKNPNHRDSYRIKFVADFPVFKLKRKVERQKIENLRPTTKKRYIVDVKPIPSIPMRCITVACSSGTYLTGKSFITTHNSHAMRLIAISYALQVPNCQIYLFRRIFSDLAKNHIEGASGFNALLADFIKSKHATITNDEITFWNGSKIYLCHCQHEKDVVKYQGAEIHILLIDELTHFTEKIYRFLRGRCRIGSLVVPAEFKEKLPLIICGSNPGGVGHDFVKQTFIDGCDSMEIRRMPDSEGGMLRQFIPAKLADNPTMTENDPLYAAKLEGLGGSLARAMLDGDWDSIDGAYFDNFDRVKHIIEPFFIPAEWFKIRAFDWGYSKPFCVLWGAVSDGSLIDCGGIKRSFPRGAIIIYREFYGCTGKANEGLKMHATDIAKNVKEMQQGEKMGDMVADPAIFDVSSGESIMEQMVKEKVHWRPADNKRVAGWQQIRARFSGQDEKPLLYFFNTCRNLIRTLPIMQYDSSKPEDLNSDMEDH